MHPTSTLAWMDRPLAADFLRFNLLPAYLLGAFWQGERRMDVPPVRPEPVVGAVPGIDPARLARHASRAILATFEKEEQVVDGFSDPALPVVMSSDEDFGRLVVACGLVVLGPSIRRIITRIELEALRRELSAQEIDFARTVGFRLWGGDGFAMPPLAGKIREQAWGLGIQMLRYALQLSSKAVMRRANLRLADGPQVQPHELPATLRDGATALALARSVLQELDPEWISLFPNPS